MRCATESEITEWLRERSITKDPYSGWATPRYYLQFDAPPTYRDQDTLGRQYFERIIPDSDCLIHITDWGLYQQSEMIAVEGIRSSSGEGRRLIDSPGHILNPSEKEAGVSLFALSASFEWNSYVYSALNNSILFNWEGEIFDFWTESAEQVSKMKLILEIFDISVTNQGEQNGVE